MAIVNDSDKPPVENTCAADCPVETCSADPGAGVPPQVEPKEKCSVSF